MKVFTHIFLIWFCLLNVQPLISFATTSVMKKETCAKKCCQSSSKKEKTNNSNNCCKNGTCNPLVSCSCCFYVGQKGEEVNLTKYSMLLDVVSSQQNYTVNDFSASCFHPPKN